MGVFQSESPVESPIESIIVVGVEAEVHCPRSKGLIEGKGKSV